MLKFYFSKKALFSLFLLCVFFLGHSQNKGDFKSVASSDWTTLSTWQVFDGSTWVSATQYPGGTPIYAGITKYKVTISSGNNVSVNNGLVVNTGNVTVMGTLTLMANLTCSGADRFTVDHGIVFFKKGAELHLKTSADLVIDIATDNVTNDYLGLHALNYDINECNNNSALYIGPIKYAACVGKGNTAAGTFTHVNGIGGSVLAAVGATPSAICFSEDQPIVVSGSSIQSLNTLNITYDLKLTSKPAGSTFTFEDITGVTGKPSVTITPKEIGDYIFTLTVHASFKNSGEISNSREVTVSVGMPTRFNGVTWDRDIPSLNNHRPAIIEESYDTAVFGSFDACSCEVTAAKTLTVSPNTYVSVLNNITNEGNIAVKSDGNLVQVNNDGMYSGGGTFKLERSTNIKRLDYTYWGSPVTGQTFYSFSPDTLASRFYSYNEEDGSFTTIPDIKNKTFMPGKGYAIRAPNNVDPVTPRNWTGTFVGTPNNGDNVSFNLKNSPWLQYDDTADSRSRPGMNMISNPYPSNIDLRILAKNNAEVTDGLFFFWTNNNAASGTNVTTELGAYGNYMGSNYVMLNALGSTSLPGTEGPSAIVKPGQGFLIHAIAPGTLKFDNSIRTINQTDGKNTVVFYKSTDTAETDRYWLSLSTPDKLKSILLIGYAAGAENGYDGRYDAIQINASDSFYSITEDRKLAIQGRKYPVLNTDTVPLGTTNYKPGIYTIGLEKAEGVFAVGQNIYLKDKQTGTVTNLSEGIYSYSADAGESIGRFEIVYQNPNKLAGVLLGDGMDVYRDGTDFIVKSRSEKITSVEIYDSSGRMIYNLQPESVMVTLPGAKLSSGMYVLKIYQNGKMTTKKIIK